MMGNLLTSVLRGGVINHLWKDRKSGIEKWPEYAYPVTPAPADNALYHERFIPWALSENIQVNKVLDRHRIIVSTTQNLIYDFE